jgi:murein DD-endopeptidase MepM/ murein hydrolase activator NlpD
LDGQLEEIETKKEEVKTIKEALENHKKELDNKKASLISEIANLEELYKKAKVKSGESYQQLLQMESASAAIQAQINAAYNGSGDYVHGGEFTGGALSWPVSGVVSSGYGMRWGAMHTGVDIAAPSGTPIVAAADGTVMIASYHYSYGNYVVVDHGSGISTLYAHNTSLAVAPGQVVSRGQVIAYCGSTGDSTGPHCHFEVRVNGAHQNPMGWLGN